MPYPIAYQIYSSRNFPPLEAQLPDLKAMGYDAIEPWLPAYEADDGKSFRRALDANGLKCFGFHMPLAGLAPALARVRRILKPGGALRLALPDLEKAIEAYNGRDAAYFAIPDGQWKSLGAKLVAQIVWHNDIRTPFTYDLAAEALAKAGFASIVRCGFRETRSRFPEIVELDNRGRESFFVEATT